MGRSGKAHVAVRGYKDRHKAWNCKGTNDYINCDTVVYMMNIYPNLSVEKYLNDKGGDWDRDEYALSSMLQFLWRSCIREGKPVTFIIPNPRMRNLFLDWLHEV